MRYLPKSDSERRQMLDVCGVALAEDLFAHLPDAVRLRRWDDQAKITGWAVPDLTRYVTLLQYLSNSAK